MLDSRYLHDVSKRKNGSLNPASLSESRCLKKPPLPPDEQEPAAGFAVIP